MGLKDWFTGSFRSFAQIREANQSAARSLTRGEAQSRIENNKLLSHPASTAQRKQILALVAGPFDQSAHRRCRELLSAALQAQNYLVRPGTVEDVWILEGLFDRLLDA